MCAPPLTYSAPAPLSLPSAVSSTLRLPLMAVERSTAKPPASRTDASTVPAADTVASVMSLTRTVPVMKVFMPTVRPPVVTSDARLPHVPYVPVPQLSVASSAFSGLIARTFSAPLVVSNVSSGLPSSAVIDNPDALSSTASMRVSNTCSGACVSTRAVSELTTRYVVGEAPWSRTVSAAGLSSSTVTDDSPLRLLKMTEPWMRAEPSTSSRCAG
mmetsp:Transcript_16966/g.27212  ORF Transcript_16966/g.27212 Transcript_16966/m.27212 type:complete len:215 (-) Transcript_16966:181-825(-)